MFLFIYHSPDYGDGEIEEDLNVDYKDAQTAGRYGVDCTSLYSTCNYNGKLFDLITVIKW